MVVGRGSSSCCRFGGVRLAFGAWSQWRAQALLFVMFDL